MIKHTLILFLMMATIASCNSNSRSGGENPHGEREQKEIISEDDPRYPEEKEHFKSLKQLTFGGDNAEAYWSFDDEKLVFQATNFGTDCDQIFVTDAANTNMKDQAPPMVSTGLGRTTCAYFMPGDTTILYASTHERGGDACPPEPEEREDGKYVWPIYPSFDIYVSDLDGNIIRKLTDREGYDAEATVSPKGDKIVFTSLRSGDLELYTMDIDGSNITQITDELGYDGGAFFSPDGSKLVWRASRPETEEEAQEYKDLLKQGLVTPTNMEIYVSDADGSNQKKITDLGKANWSPFFHPSGEKIVFSSNHHSDRGFKFNLFMINIDGTGLKQITHDPVFDAFPVFSYGGNKLVFSSNRNNGGTYDTNLFLAEWKD
ncbi:MAG: TolB family protein [Bacteroidota bacterium]